MSVFRGFVRLELWVNEPVAIFAVGWIVWNLKRPEQMIFNTFNILVRSEKGVLGNYFSRLEQIT